MVNKPPKTPKAKLPRRRKKREDNQHGLSYGSYVNDRTHAITIRVSTQMLSEIDSRIAGHRKLQRERFVLDALESYLRHREASYSSPDKVTKAISKSTAEIRTGRYERDAVNDQLFCRRFKPNATWLLVVQTF
jgi:hypothetical protein